MKAVRKGFTLIEVLAAAAISGALMLGLFGALDLSARYRTAGRDQVQCDRVANAVARYVEATLREAPITVEDEQDSAYSPKAARRAARVRPLIESVSDPVLITGDRTTLIVGVRGADGSTSQGRTGRTVRILTTEQVRFDSLPGLWRRRTVGGDGFARHRGGRLSTMLLREVETASSLAPSRWEAEDSIELSDEIRRLTFRYFDGLAWTPNWDGDGRKRLQAVEVSFVACSGTVERPIQFVIATLANGGRR